jgi:hypothetical protein
MQPAVQLHQRALCSNWFKVFLRLYVALTMLEKLNIWSKMPLWYHQIVLSLTQDYIFGKNILPGVPGL